MRAPDFDAGDVYPGSDKRTGCLVTGLAGGGEPSEAHIGKFGGSVFDDRIEANRGKIADLLINGLDCHYSGLPSPKAYDE